MFWRGGCCLLIWRIEIFRQTGQAEFFGYVKSIWITVRRDVNIIDPWSWIWCNKNGTLHPCFFLKCWKAGMDASTVMADWVQLIRAPHRVTQSKRHWTQQMKGIIITPSDPGMHARLGNLLPPPAHAYQPPWPSSFLTLKAVSAIWCYFYRILFTSQIQTHQLLWQIWDMNCGHMSFSV